MEDKVGGLGYSPQMNFGEVLEWHVGEKIVLMGVINNVGGDQMFFDMNSVGGSTVHVTLQELEEFEIQPGSPVLVVGTVLNSDSICDAICSCMLSTGEEVPPFDSELYKCAVNSITRFTEFFKDAECAQDWKILLQIVFGNYVW